MDQIGLIAEITDSVSTIYRGRLWLDTDGFERDGRISYRDGLSQASVSFTEVLAGVEASVETLIMAEQAFLVQELKFCVGSDTNAFTSLTQGILSFDEALCALKEVNAGSSYGIMDRALPHRGECRYRGMPKDAFHWACFAHTMRIKNVLRSPGINEAEKALLQQRNANIAAAQSVYLKKQQKALALTS